MFVIRMNTSWCTAVCCRRVIGHLTLRLVYYFFKYYYCSVCRPTVCSARASTLITHSLTMLLWLNIPRKKKIIVLHIVLNIGHGGQNVRSRLFSLPISHKWLVFPKTEGKLYTTYKIPVAGNVRTLIFHTHAPNGPYIQVESDKKYIYIYI